MTTEQTDPWGTIYLVWGGAPNKDRITATDEKLVDHFKEGSDRLLDAMEAFYRQRAA